MLSYQPKVDLRTGHIVGVAAMSKQDLGKMLETEVHALLTAGLANAMSASVSASEEFGERRLRRLKAIAGRDPVFRARNAL